MSTSLSNRVSVGSAGWLLKEAKGAQFELNLVEVLSLYISTHGCSISTVSRVSRQN